MPFAASLALAACGGSDDGGTPGDPPLPTEVPLEALCEQVALADCRRLAACDALSAPIDEAACEARQAAVLCAPLQAALQTAVARGQLVYTATAGAACRDAVGAQSCDVGLDHDWFDLSACRAAVVGLAAPGEPCNLSIACTEGAACALDATCGDGTCIALAQINELCSLQEPCAPPLYCSLTGMRCRAPAALGATCEVNIIGNGCQAGAFCDATQPGQPRCVPVRGRGQGCTSVFQCVEGATCLNNRCSAGLDGDGCTDDDDCQRPRSCIGDTCLAPAAIDTPCSDDQPCAEGLTCTSTQSQMLCRPLSATGEACGECYQGTCIEGLCVPWADDGDPCAAAEDCFPDRTCAGTCQPPAACF